MPSSDSDVEIASTDQAIAWGDEWVKAYYDLLRDFRRLEARLAKADTDLQIWRKIADYEGRLELPAGSLPHCGVIPYPHSN